jgi:hypothetical protein
MLKHLYKINGIFYFVSRFWDAIKLLLRRTSVLLNCCRQLTVDGSSAYANLDKNNIHKQNLPSCHNKEKWTKESKR